MSEAPPVISYATAIWLLTAEVGRSCCGPPVPTGPVGLSALVDGSGRTCSTVTGSGPGRLVVTGTSAEVVPDGAAGRGAVRAGHAPSSMA